MRYQFQSEYGQHSWRPQMFTDAIKVLIGINVVVYILSVLARGTIDLNGIFGLTPRNVWPLIWQPVTYMFMHGNLWHILINMFVLWMFGSELDMIWGKTNFLKYYFITGIGSGLVWLLFNLGNTHAVLIGASGAIYGILLAYGLMFPNRTVYLYFMIPIKVKWFVIILGAIAFFSSFSMTSNISHLTHLSGMVIGYFYLKQNIRWSHLSFYFRKHLIEMKTRQKKRKKSRDTERYQEIDRILDKINDVGYEGLTEEERDTLYRASRRMGKDRKKD